MKNDFRADAPLYHIVWQMYWQKKCSKKDNRQSGGNTDYAEGVYAAAQPSGRSSSGAEYNRCWMFYEGIIKPQGQKRRCPHNGITESQGHPCAGKIKKQKRHASCSQAIGQGKTHGGIYPVGFIKKQGVQKIAGTKKNYAKVQKFTYREHTGHFFYQSYRKQQYRMLQAALFYTLWTAQNTYRLSN
jgi:hypothetical protein